MFLSLSIPSIISVKNTLIPENYPDYLMLVRFDLQFLGNDSNNPDP